ncbi:Ni/Fe-hydrogenase, b-type cytochrome subunit [Campylobacter sp. LR291e]|uniref:Ni/Fe-hydrogenase, b-type cytochrome subunit n=1 Tax=unclassified Campylobacter TaxID=2593542 RepID=UPI0012383102|nr:MULTISPECIES: Ni/Fe-hydrogenase, b-type cytochrome subunit [unclassified Campylobacter]KAA6224721.1 Ni/Fe-hydrogenase, b-type cytochrome subunit [Campylobacter sp. LR185c]KAA6225839.1 Ni/Fe-hydrogenase, b-type cytochrome subunit [Campylobacter sp. LR196d]KAA6229692.1 Ni/Fe-hydrogenase, b-type cytochrome subunit [Campylobacter sp. LR291e]KAA6230062.1 Ni/Fe-hydrogenase, b-type cytochrome subunit [Campylobacter sp. LR264d]KAA8603938.1 Ni/Fe-hydrogenase, b-type cytochrome subunit [Campylobacter
MQDRDKALQRKADYEFSIGLRFTHWVRAVCIVVLAMTGFYLSYVFISAAPNSEPTSFLQANIRLVHQAVGFVLIGCVIFKIYLFFFDRVSAKERISIVDTFNVKLWIEQIKFYLFVGKHPSLKGVYNPLQFVTYFFFYLVIFGIILTGLILYVHTYHEGLAGALHNLLRPVEAMFGGLASVRTWHRIFMWIILIFVPIHIYMAVFNAVKGKDGALDAIISGYRFIKEEKN